MIRGAYRGFCTLVRKFGAGVFRFWSLSVPQWVGIYAPCHICRIWWTCLIAFLFIKGVIDTLLSHFFKHLLFNTDSGLILWKMTVKCDYKQYLQNLEYFFIHQALKYTFLWWTRNIFLRMQFCKITPYWSFCCYPMFKRQTLEISNWCFFTIS